MIKPFWQRVTSGYRFNLTMGVSVSNVMQIAVDHRARLEAEVTKIEKFLSFADVLTQQVDKPIADLPLEECESVVQEDNRVAMFEPTAAEPESEELTLSEPSPAPSPAEAPAAAQAAPEAAPKPQPEAPKPEAPRAEAREDAPQAPAADAASKESDAGSLQDSLDALKRALKQ